VPFSRAKVSFALFVPVQAYEVARRLCDAHRVSVGEIWTYRSTFEGFDLIRMFQDAATERAEKSAKPDRPEAPAKPAKPANGAAVKTAAPKKKPAAKPAKPAKPAKKAAPAKSAKKKKR
jgi:hypothetical protein